MVDARYRIVAPLGRGGMGEVYRADDLKLGQPVALKFLPEGLERDEQRMSRLLDEVKIARQVSHTNVCRVYDVGETDGLHYLSMEYVDGEDLASLLRRIGRLPQEKAVQVARQICAGVAAAHEQGILHRDLKPANVMIDGRGRVKVTDFGLAGLETEIRGDGIRSGTPAYMAPEQLAGQNVTARSDVYALGLVLYELFTGRAAFESPSLTESIRLRKEASPSRPSSHVTDLDPAIERLILRCLEVEPHDRPTSALAVASALRGEDPLAAVRAAGETPSPEMVADAGPAGGLELAVASLCLAVCLGGVALVPYWYENSLVGRVSLELPPEALTVKAREVVRAAGHTDPPVDFAYGFAYDNGYLQFAEEQDPASRWRDLESIRPAPIYFWYRQSPSYLTPQDVMGSATEYLRVTPHDPPPVTHGMVGVRLDPQGRLLRLEVVPPVFDESKNDGTEPDWSALFSQAGLDPSRLAEVQPTHNPLRGADVRRAWRGTYPDGSPASLRIEAAAYRGRPTSFRVEPPWASAGRTTSPQVGIAAKVQAIVSSILFLILLGTGLLFARRNLRQGRGDRPGAFRIARLVFGSFMLMWAFGADHQPTLDEVGLGLLQTAVALFLASVTWLVYLALEPYARKIWPEIMVSWNRLMQGRWRDPMVGRDVLVGIAASMIGGFLNAMPYLLAEPMGFPSPRPATNVSLIGLIGIRQSIANSVEIPAQALGTTVLTLFILLLWRILLRRPWAAASALVLLSGSMSALGSPNPVVALAAAVPLAILDVVILVRFGFLAAVVSGVAFSVGAAQVHTWNLSAWYAGRAWMLLLLLAAVAVYAFRISLAGRPIFRLDESPGRGA
jgi:serine/threonine-protein kinase